MAKYMTYANLTTLIDSLLQSDRIVSDDLEAKIAVMSNDWNTKLETFNTELEAKIADIDVGDLSNNSTIVNISNIVADLQKKVDYVAPQIVTYIMSPNTTSYEIGTIIPSLVLSWTLNKMITSQTLNSVQ